MNKSIYIKDYYVLPTKQLSDLLSFGLNIVPELSYNFYELNSLFFLCRAYVSFLTWGGTK